MITLAFDTTAKVASVAVTRDGVALGYYSIDNGLTQSELILPMAESLLASLKLDISKVGLFACSVGPGSFTGVRIGVSVVKGLAFGRDIPCCAVSTLEALAENASSLDAIIVPCMDARRSQVYSATFESTGEGLRRLTEDRAISLASLAEELKAYEGRDIYLVGDGYAVAYKALTEAGVKLSRTPTLLINENAASVAKVAERMYERGESVSESALSPVYLRLPQAERERLERLGKE